MAITREEVERMEEQAGLSRRFNAASDDYVARNNPRLRAMERESVLRTAEADVYNKARQRRIDSQRLVAIADPGRFSPFERNSLLGIDKNGGALIDRQERAGLLAHELAIADKGIEQERVKAWGMANQGGVAAGINAREKRIETEARFGRMLDDGTYIPGSDVRAAEVTGLSKQEIAMINSAGRLDYAKANNESHERIAKSKNESNERIAKSKNESNELIGAGHDQARIDASGNIAGATLDAAALRVNAAEQAKRAAIVQDVMQGKYIMSGMTPKKWKKMTPEQQQAWIGSLK